jgi:hypothetical protein
MKRSQAVKLIAKELLNVTTYDHLSEKYANVILTKLEELGYRPTIEEKLAGDTLRLLEEYEEE